MEGMICTKLRIGVVIFQLKRAQCTCVLVAQEEAVFVAS